MIRPPAETDRDILAALFRAALSAAMPAGRFESCLPTPPKGRTIVLGAGKAAASMAAAFEAAWKHPCEGLVVTRYGHGMPTLSIEVVEAAHPLPNEAGQAAAERILALARAAGPDDLVVALISGGASALLSVPASGITLEDKRLVNRALLRSGMPIREMNVVRRSLSAVKGGRLALAAAPARVVTYVISDVPGDDPAVIGSGPTVREDHDPAAALAILDRCGIVPEERLRRAIERNAVQRGGPVAADEVHRLATPMMALEAAADAARSKGIEPVILGDAIEGEAREVAADHARLALETVRDRPFVLLSGGETTVTVRGEGRGGRNAEYLLALADALRGRQGISAIACDTDGIDGSEDNAGAWIDDRFPVEARERGVDIADHLRRNDAYTAFAALGRLVTTGPTLTNVNDFRAILVRDGESR